VLTPDWWPSNQYGRLKTISITPEGTFMDDAKMSDITLAHVLAQIKQFWSIRFEVKAGAKNAGGLSLYGKQFGNHAQDIVMRIFYEKMLK
jgi:predicted transcriptional regulator